MQFRRLLSLEGTRTCSLLSFGDLIEMLRSMMDKTQFIIITHSRKTMEIANRLYGVTMEEPGVSKLISIQLQ